MLMNYPDRAGAGGTQLQPKIAAGMPSLSADGRTYVFTIRPGYWHSPPSNQPVTAEAVRYSIERALSPRLGSNSPGPQVIADIAGEQAFRDGNAAHISGVRAAGDRLTIELTRPSPDSVTTSSSNGTPTTQGPACTSSTRSSSGRASTQGWRWAA